MDRPRMQFILTPYLWNFLTLGKYAMMDLKTDQIGPSLTRLDTRQDSRGRLDGGRNAKTTRNSEIFGTSGLTDRHGNVKCVRD